MIASAKTERQLTYGYGKTRLTDEQSKLVADNLGLCFSMMKKYSTINALDWNERLSEAALPGLIRAARSFDPGRGIKFSTFACTCIISNIHRHYTDGNTYAHRYEQVVGKTDDYSIEDFADERRQDHSDLDNETKLMVRDLLKYIHGRHRTAVEMRFFYGMKIKEIAALFDVTTHRTAQIIDEALATMRQYATE